MIIIIFGGTLRITLGEQNNIDEIAFLLKILKEKFHILTREEYVDIVCDELEYLDENIVINRITGDPDVDELVEPTWLIKKFGVLNEIDKELKRRDSYQGIKKRKN